jgi:FHS family L-fucose permease-like MFS transporter
MAGGGIPFAAPTLASGFLRGKALIFPLSLVISLFFLWGFSYGLLDVLNKHFQTVLDITKLQSTCLQVVYFGGGYLLFSPVAAEVMKRKGYKITILMGLSLYSLGAIFFWVSIPPSTPSFSSIANIPIAYCTLLSIQPSSCLLRWILCLYSGDCLWPRNSRNSSQFLRRRDW